MSITKILIHFAFHISTTVYIYSKWFTLIFCKSNIKFSFYMLRFIQLCINIGIEPIGQCIIFSIWHWFLLNCFLCSPINPLYSQDLSVLTLKASLNNLKIKLMFSSFCFDQLIRFISKREYFLRLKMKSMSVNFFPFEYVLFKMHFKY